MESNHLTTIFDRNQNQMIVILDWNIDYHPSTAADLLRGNVNDETLVIVRCNATESLKNKEIPEFGISEISKRAGQAECVFLYSTNHVFKALDKDGNKFNDSETEEIINRVRQEELREMLFKSDAIYTLPKRYYFRSPSNAIVNYFVRAGNIQKSTFCIDVIFFWLLPYLREIDGIIVDTWSISSSAYNIARRLLKYRKRSRKKNIYVGILSQYFNNKNQSKIELENAISMAVKQGTQNLLFLYSASATGKSIRLLEQQIGVLSDKYPINGNFMSIYQLMSTPYKCMCDLSSVINIQINPDKKVLKEKLIYDIDPSSYFPFMISEKNEKHVDIKKVVTCQKEFFDTYGGKNVFYAHRDALNINGENIGHHAVYIDVENALNVAEFQSKLSEIIDDLPKPPLCVVTKSHTAGEKLATFIIDLINKRFGTNPILFSVHNIFEDQKLKAKIESAKNDEEIMLVDDVLITGRSFSKFQRQTRSLKFKGKITYLVGFTRCKSINYSNKIKGQFCWNDTDDKPTNRYFSVEEVILPDWGYNMCPWCTELTELSILQDHLDLSESARNLILDRIHELDACSEIGLQNNLFWLPNKDYKLNIGPNSLFIEGENLSQADVVSSVAGALQYYRKIGAPQGSLGKLQLGSKYPLRVMLSRKNQFMSLWSDPILTYSIWRMARDTELRSIISDYEQRCIVDLEHMFNSFDNEEDLKTGYLELTVNLLNSHLPQPTNNLLARGESTTEGTILNSVNKYLFNS